MAGEEWTRGGPVETEEPRDHLRRTARPLREICRRVHCGWTETSNFWNGYMRRRGPLGRAGGRRRLLGEL